MRALKRVLRAALVFLPLLALLVGVNWYADPGNAIRGDYERKVAAILAAGENAANLNNMDDRAFMRAYLPLRTQPIDTLALGSSHSMQITKELTGDGNTFCGGMTGADLRDCISLYRLVKEEGFAPENVILVVDSWFLSEGTVERRAMTDGYLDFCADYGLEPVRSAGWDQAWQEAEKKLQLFSVSYFQSSVEFLKTGKAALRDPVATTSFYSESGMRRADGSYCYEAAYRDPDSGNAYQNVSDMMQVKPDFVRNFTGESDNLIAQLAAFIAELQADGCQVAVMIPPFHPDYYAFMAARPAEYGALLATEQTIRDIAGQAGAAVFGSFDPAACGLTAADFYDGLHCSDTAMYKFYPQDLFD